MGFGFPLCCCTGATLRTRGESRLGSASQCENPSPYRTIYSFMEWLNNDSPLAAWKYERRRPANGTPGVWAADVSGTGGASGKSEIVPPEQYAQLEALGYLGATVVATDASGVTINDQRAHRDSISIAPDTPPKRCSWTCRVMSSIAGRSL